MEATANRHSNVPGGMIVRLQGFDRGLFGGNFHTHNSLSNVLLPGLEVVCYSNGYDYVRGLRYAMKQVKGEGRVVVFVDCTSLLNQRHIHNNDRQWETIYPEQATHDAFSLDSIKIYRDSQEILISGDQAPKKRLAIISYGNGVVTSLQARSLIKQQMNAHELLVDVVDSPCLNRVPQGLMDALYQYDCILWADIAKRGPGSVFESFILDPSVQRVIACSGGKSWKLVAAPRTYNALGSFVSFLNKEDIAGAARSLIQV